MKDDEFAQVLESTVPPTPGTDGWLAGARRRRRRRQGVAAGVVGLVVLALAVPAGMNLAGTSIDAMPADPTTTATTAGVCQSDNVLDPSVDVADPAEFTRAVGCTGNLLGQDQRELELPAELVLAVATSVLADSVPDAEGEWSYEDSSLLLVTDDGGTVELWQISIRPGELTYLWKQGGQLMVWTPDTAVATQLREHLGVE